jgi:hypothetical protein
MARLKWIRGLPRRFVRIGHARRMLLMEAALWLALARIALVAVPFRHIARRTGAFARPNDPAVKNVLGAAPNRAEQALAQEIGWAVTRAARYLPFKAVCLPQALAARRMLQRRGVASVLHFGANIRNDPEQRFDAHAWLDTAGVEVTGYPEARDFTEIGCFV